MASDVPLEVRFRHRIGTLHLDVAFKTNAPWTVLFGPSGSGKSTILRVIAGLERPLGGRVRMGGSLVLDTRSRICWPAHHRPMRWAAQRAMLFPRRTVRGNVAMGIGLREESNGGSRLLERALEHFGLLGLADKMPDELSGGQRQLVAVARVAIGARRRLLLLDEPFSGLDAGVRNRLIADLRSWLGETRVVSVTHDVGEAFLLEAEVVRIGNGRVVAQGLAADVLAEERRRLIKVLG